MKYHSILCSHPGKRYVQTQGMASTVPLLVQLTVDGNCHAAKLTSSSLCPTDAVLVCVQVLTGLGPVSQLSVTTGLPRIAVQLLLAAFVAHGVFGFTPGTPTWSSQNRHVREVLQLPAALLAAREPCNLLTQLVYDSYCHKQPAKPVT